MWARRSGVLTALILTAILLYLMPGLVRGRLNDTGGRMDERLRPAPARTLVVWVISDAAEDRKLLSTLCSAFEKEQKGLHVYLRRVDAEELYAQDAVLPDVLMHVTGEITASEEILLPLHMPDGMPELLASSGRSKGVQYALPLWYSPNVLSLPRSWFVTEGKDQVTITEGAYFSLQTPTPTEVDPDLPVIDNLPWAKLTECGTIRSLSSVGFQQLLLCCPMSLRQELSACVPTNESAPEEALLQSLTQHESAVAAGSALAGVALSPVVSDRVRYVSLCRDGADARAFAAYLLSDAAQQQTAAHLLLPVQNSLQWPGSGLMSELGRAAQESLLLPNCFAHTREEIRSLCMDDFRRGEDAAVTLLRLR